MRICTIYLHTNTVKNNIHNKPTPYVGQTWDTVTRRSRNGKGYKPCIKFWRAICKYRWENFSTLELATVIEPDNATEQEKDILQDQANYLERLFQDVYDSRKNGYNIREGGSNGRHSPESIKNNSDSQNATYQKRLLETGSKMSDETIKNMSDGKLGNQNAKGFKHTQETKDKNRDAQTGKKHPHKEATKVLISKTKLAKHLVSPKKTNSNKEQQIIASYQSGYGAEKVADIHKISMVTVYRILRRNNVKRRQGFSARSKKE
jgi:hypothetical protein